MSLKAVALASHLQHTLNALASAGDSLIPAIDNRPLDFDAAQQVLQLTHHGLATRMRDGRFILNQDLRRFVRGVLSRQMLRQSDMPNTVSLMNDMAAAYADFLGASREGNRQDMDDALEGFTDTCQQLMTGMENTIRAITRDYEACRDDAGSSFARKSRRNARIITLIRQLLEIIRHLRHGWYDDNPDLIEIMETLPGVRSLRHLNDSYGFNRAYTRNIGQYVDQWLHDVEALSAEVTRYFVRLKEVQIMSLKAEAVNKFLKRLPEGGLHVTPTPSLEHCPAEDQRIRARVLIDWWAPENHDALMPMLAAVGTKLNPPARAEPRKRIDSPVMTQDDSETEQGYTLLNLLSLQLMTLARRTGKPVHILHHLDVVIAAKAKEGMFLNREVCFLAVYHVIARCVELGEPMAAGIAAIHLMGQDDDHAGYIRARDVVIIPKNQPEAA